MNRLVDASRIAEDLEQGVRKGDLSKLDKFHAKLKAKAGN